MAYILAALYSTYSCMQNGLQDLSSYEVMVQQYYQASPYEFCGTTTRYGSTERSIHELYWLAQEVVAQYEHGYVMLAGNYGFQWIDGVKYLLDNRASLGYSRHIQKGDEQQLNEAQLRLYDLGRMDELTFRAYIQEHYVGVISIKSPNDIGREYCLRDVGGFQLGTAIVGGTAARHDWMPIGYRSHPETIGLGLLQNYDEQGYVWQWAADLPDHIFYALSLEGENPIIKLTEGRCKQEHRMQRN